MDGELEPIEAEIVQSEEVEALNQKAEKLIKHTMNDFNSRQLMAMALIKTGLTNEEVCHQANINKAQYNRIYKKYHNANFDQLTTEVIDNWEMILRAKMMNVTEKALDKTYESLDNDEMKDAKMASSVFNEVFGTFRLSTGKSTENIETTTTKLITSMIESRTGLQKPNQSQYHDNVAPIDTKPPSITEVM